MPKLLLGGEAWHRKNARVFLTSWQHQHVMKTLQVAICFLWFLLNHCNSQLKIVYIYIHLPQISQVCNLKQKKPSNQHVFKYPNNATPDLSPAASKLSLAFLAACGSKRSSWRMEMLFTLGLVKCHLLLFVMLFTVPCWTRWTSKKTILFFYKLDITEKSGNRRGQKQDTLSAFDTDSFPEKKQQPCTTSTTTTTSKTACALWPFFHQFSVDFFFVTSKTHQHSNARVASNALLQACWRPYAFREMTLMARLSGRLSAQFVGLDFFRRFNDWPL